MKVLITFLLVLFAGGISIAQEEKTITHTIESEVFGNERKFHVFLPARYARDTASTFIVVYVLDAQYDQFWNMAKGNLDYLVDSYSVIPMIGVGIHSDNRGSEFAPPGEDLSAHLKNEVFPLVESNYRTTPFRVLIGHSWAGSYIAHTLFQGDADMFDAYIAISPSMGGNQRELLKKADSTLQARDDFGKYYYASSGDVGSREANFGSQVRFMDSIIQAHPNPTLKFESDEFPLTGHWSCVIPSFNYGLVKMSQHYFADIAVMQKMVENSNEPLFDQVAAFNADRQKNYGYHFVPSDRYLRFAASDFLELGHYAAARDLCKKTLETMPGDLRVLLNLCEVYDYMDDPDEARWAYDEALKALEGAREDRGENYYNNVKEWIDERIAKLDGK